MADPVEQVIIGHQSLPASTANRAEFDRACDQLWHSLLAWEASSERWHLTLSVERPSQSEDQQQ